MVERRVVRILSVQSPVLHCVDRGRELGLTYEAAKTFEAQLNETLGTGNVKVHVLLMPVARDELLPRLLAGQGDIAAATLTVTPERLEQVDFSDPFAEGVSEIVVTGPGSDALTVPIGVLNEVDTSPSSTQPMVRPPRLIGIPTVSCFTVSLVPSIVGPLPSATRNGVAPLRARPDFCTAYAPRPAAIAATTRSGTQLEMTVGKTSDCKDDTQPRIQIDNMIVTDAATRFQRKLTSALPAPELVSVRRTRPRKNSPKPARSTVTEYCWIPRGPLMSQTMPRSVDMPVNVAAVRLVASDILDSRPISINLLSP